MTDHPIKKNSSRPKPLLYELKGDIRTLSKARITARRILSNLQHQAIILSVDLERQHGKRPLYGGALHLDLNVYFISDLPIYRQKKTTRSLTENYSTNKPYISTLIGLIEKIGEGIIFSDGTHISSVCCLKKYTKKEEPYLTFSVTELRNI